MLAPPSGPNQEVIHNTISILMISRAKMKRHSGLQLYQTEIQLLPAESQSNIYFR